MNLILGNNNYTPEVEEEKPALRGITNFCCLGKMVVWVFEIGFVGNLFYMVFIESLYFEFKHLHKNLL